jgi:hypothetical protein
MMPSKTRAHCTTCSQALGSDIFSPPPYSAEIKEIEKMSDGTATCIDIILAIILPPLGVFFKFGCGVRGSYLALGSPAGHRACMILCAGLFVEDRVCCDV